jgi:hypothetical protein
MFMHRHELLVQQNAMPHGGAQKRAASRGGSVLRRVAPGRAAAAQPALRSLASWKGGSDADMAKALLVMSAQERRELLQQYAEYVGEQV